MTYGWKKEIGERNDRVTGNTDKQRKVGEGDKKLKTKTKRIS
jgi:hypothetical protein